MKTLSQETNLGIGTTVSSATVVRVYNSNDSVGIVTRKDSGGSTIGNLTIPSKKIVYLEKKFNDTIVAPATVKASKIAYSPVMEYASWTAGGGGASYHTVNRAESYGVINSSTSVDGVFTETFTNCATVPLSGKRYYMINLSYRLVSGDSFANAASFFQTATVSLANHTPTYQTVAKTGYNMSALYTGFADLNSSGSDANIVFSFNNSGFDSPDGGYALAIWIFDYVEEADFNTQVISNDENANNNSAGPVNVAPGGTGTGWTASFKFVTGVASNPPDNDNPLWTKGSGESDTTYILLQEGDHGTNEVSETSDAFYQNNGNLSNITGTMTLDDNQYASDGLGILAVHARFKPAQQ